MDREYIIQLYNNGWSAEEIADETGNDELDVRRVIRDLAEQDE